MLDAYDLWAHVGPTLDELAELISTDDREQAAHPDARPALRSFLDAVAPLVADRIGLDPDLAAERLMVVDGVPETCDRGAQRVAEYLGFWWCAHEVELALGAGDEAVAMAS